MLSAVDHLNLYMFVSIMHTFAPITQSFPLLASHLQKLDLIALLRTFALGVEKKSLLKQVCTSGKV